MNGVHDMGGLHGFGPVVAEPGEPVFHARWEGLVRALMNRSGRYFHLDEFRHAIERMPADQYLRASYYEKWLHAIETLLVEKRVLSEEELATGRAAGAVPAPPAARAPAPPLSNPRFAPGDPVRTRNLNPRGHTRLPRYARNRRGVVRTVNGPFLLPDTNAHGGGPDWQPCYAVEFEARELWGEGSHQRDRVCIDLWEGYLEPEARL